MIIKRYGRDWSNLILSDVNFEMADLREIILSDDTELFQRIENKSLIGTYLPKGDYSDYNFNEVWLVGCVFTLDSVFSDDKEVFQLVGGKNINEAILPKGDYRLYNFKGVNKMGVRFSRDSILPEYEDFLKDIRPLYYGSYFSDNVIRNVHAYNLDGVVIDLTEDRYKRILNQKQLDIIKTKYHNAIGENIYLPDKVYGKDIPSNYDF